MHLTLKTDATRPASPNVLHQQMRFDTFVHRYNQERPHQRRKINVSQVFAGEKVGVKQVAEHIWLVTFMQYDLGYFDDETCRLEPIENPFGPKVLPLRSE